MEAADIVDLRSRQTSAEVRPHDRATFNQATFNVNIKKWRHRNDGAIGLMKVKRGQLIVPYGRHGDQAEAQNLLLSAICGSAGESSEIKVQSRAVNLQYGLSGLGGLRIPVHRILTISILSGLYPQIAGLRLAARTHAPMYDPEPHSTGCRAAE